MSGKATPRNLALFLAATLLCVACGAGSDDGAETPSSQPTAAPVEGALAFASDKGITVSVTSIVAEQSSTLVVFYVTGRPDLGAGVRIGEPMNDQTGKMVMPRTGRIDETDPRRMTMIYASIPATPGTIRAPIRRIEFWDGAVRAPGTPYVPGAIIEGNWLIEIPFDGTVKAAAPVTVQTGAASFGPGTFELLGATVESGTLVVQGRVGGFTELQLQAMRITVTMSGPGGSSFAPTNMRAGFGDRASGVTLQFVAPLPGQYTVRATLNQPSHPFEATPVAQLQPHVGAFVERTLTVP